MIARSTFVDVVRSLWAKHEPSVRIIETEAKALRSDPDWFWTALVTSYCTNGGSDNLFRKRAKYGQRLSWSAVSRMSETERAALFDDLPNGRRAHQLTPALHESFDRIQRTGGPRELAAEYESLPSANEVLRFLRTFPGIGAKYSRNMAMDVYDERVLDHAALDDRLNRILDGIEGAPAKSSYRGREDYLRGIQQEAGLPTLWHLDRLLYNTGQTVL